jgi:hypothetical protein
VAGQHAHATAADASGPARPHGFQAPPACPLRPRRHPGPRLRGAVREGQRPGRNPGFGGNARTPQLLPRRRPERVGFERAFLRTDPLPQPLPRHRPPVVCPQRHGQVRVHREPRRRPRADQDGLRGHRRAWR